MAYKYPDIMITT